jgi:hypothetical protein
LYHGKLSKSFFLSFRLRNYYARWFVALGILFAWAGSLEAATYYVRTDGNDSNSGTASTASEAWATINHAATASLSPGDVVYVQAGSYSESVTVTVDGTAANPISFIADTTGTVSGWTAGTVTILAPPANICLDLGNDDYVNNWNRNYNNNYSSNSGYVSFTIPSLEHLVEIFIMVTSVMLFTMGCVYFIMGLMFIQGKIERDIEAFRQRLRLCDKNFGDQEDVLQRRFGGRVAEEMGMTHTV